MPGVTLDIHCFFCLENKGTKCHTDFDHATFYEKLIHNGIVYTSEILNLWGVRGYGGSISAIQTIVNDHNTNLTTGGIGFREIESRRLTVKQKKDLQKLGMNMKSHHRCTIECANSSDTKRIISNDIHLYEPKAKEKEKTKIKEKGVGHVTKYLKGMDIMLSLCINH